MILLFQSTIGLYYLHYFWFDPESFSTVLELINAAEDLFSRRSLFCTGACFESVLRKTHDVYFPSLSESSGTMSSSRVYPGQHQSEFHKRNGWRDAGLTILKIVSCCRICEGLFNCFLAPACVLDGPLPPLSEELKARAANNRRKTW